MPDYLGEHQRKVKQDDKSEDTIQGVSDGFKLQSFNGRAYRERNVSPTCTFHNLSFSSLVALDEGDIQILKTYVSLKFRLVFVLCIHHHSCVYRVQGRTMTLSSRRKMTSRLL